MSHFKNTVTDWFSFFSLSLDKNAKKIFSKKIRFITASSNKKDMASNFKTEIKRKPLVEVKLEAGFHGPPGPGTDRSELVRDLKKNILKNLLVLVRSGPRFSNCYWSWSGPRFLFFLVRNQAVFVRGSLVIEENLNMKMEFESEAKKIEFKEEINHGFSKNMVLFTLKLDSLFENYQGWGFESKLLIRVMKIMKL